MRKGYPEYNPEQARGEGGRWTAGGSDIGTRFAELRARFREDMPKAEAQQLKREVTALQRELNSQLKEVRELGRRIGAKPKPWWQTGEKPSDQAIDRIGGALGRNGYNEAQAKAFLHRALIREDWDIPKPARGETFAAWLDGVVNTVPSSIVMSIVLNAPKYQTARQRERNSQWDAQHRARMRALERIKP